MTRRRILWALLAAYGAAVMVVVSWPVPVDSGMRGSLSVVIRNLQQAGLTFVNYADIEFSANVLMFAPLGLLFACLAGAGRRLLVLAVCIAGSLTIELGQLLFLPHRFASAGDVLANSLGAGFGVAIAAAASRFARAARVKRARVRAPS